MILQKIIYTHPDLLPRFCKINLSNTKNSAGIFFPGLINLLWLLINVIEDDCQFLGVLMRLSTRCEICRNVEMFTMKNNTIIVIWFLCDVQNYAESEVGIILFNLHNLSHRTLPHSINYVLV